MQQQQPEDNYVYDEQIVSNYEIRYESETRQISDEIAPSFTFNNSSVAANIGHGQPSQQQQWQHNFHSTNDAYSMQPVIGQGMAMDEGGLHGWAGWQYGPTGMQSNEFMKKCRTIRTKSIGKSIC
jgi:hypothetical protein